MRTGQGEARARAKGIAVVGGCGGARGDGERFGVSKLASRVINFRTTPLRPDSPAHTSLNFRPLADGNSCGMSCGNCTQPANFW